MKTAVNRDLNPHKGAVAAMWVYHDRYAATGKGSMGFWDSLSRYEKGVCRDLLRRLETAYDAVSEDYL